MTNKIFRSTILVAAVVLLCSLGIIMGVLYGYFNDVQIAQLKDELSLAAIGTKDFICHCGPPGGSLHYEPFQ